MTPWGAPGSSIHGISQARILECVAISFSRGSSPLWSPALQADSLLLRLLGSPRWLNNHLLFHFGLLLTTALDLLHQKIILGNYQ